MNSRSVLFVILSTALLACSSEAASPSLQARTLAVFPAPDANQAVAVDAKYFYAINNTRISRHEKHTGVVDLQWGDESLKNNPLIHLDSGMVYQNRLYAAHSNFPQWPMSSSIEVWDTETLQHLESHTFEGVQGSMTWLDRHEDYWWGGFGNYDRIIPPRLQAYGKTENTFIVKMDDSFKILEQWQLPEELLPRLRPMSNSGGGWGADGYLYLTGHDHPEIYVMEVPLDGSVLKWVTTILVEGFDGQGIAWDRSTGDSILWGISRDEATVLQLEMPRIQIQ